MVIVGMQKTKYILTLTKYPPFIETLMLYSFLIFNF